MTFVTATFAAVAVFTIWPAWAVTVTLQSDTSSPAPVGTSIGWTATSTEENTWYRFRVRSPEEADFRVIRDFSPLATWEWVPSRFEGRYEIEITARNQQTGDTSSTTQSYDIASRVSSDSPVITPTHHPLVFLYSAPPCPAGSELTVNYAAAGGRSQSTSPIPCLDGKSVNIYLAGLRAETTYTVQHTVGDENGGTSIGPELTLQTGSLPFTPSQTRAAVPSQEQGIVFQNRIFERSVATDLEGNVIWYYPEETPYLIRPEPGGYFFALIEDFQRDTSGQLLRQVDLAGNVLRETNAGWINEQLAAMGKNPITSFHHEARQMPNGNILVLAGTERLMTDVQGPGEVDVLGDMILVLDADLKVTWAWDGFDHLDVTRKALLGQKCVQDGGGCPVFYLGETANDWLHGNSLALTPDGHIVYSSRHQDWLIKIDYANGAGSGSVLWRLGREGDFSLASGNANDWFSHQHDANFVGVDTTNYLLVFDNGNVRRTTDENAHSRGQLWELDQVTKTARLVLNVDMGTYAIALGSADRLPNGNFYFGLGWTPEGHSRLLEYDLSGRLVSELEVDTQVYRAVRMPSLYVPAPGKWAEQATPSKSSRR